MDRKTHLAIAATFASEYYELLMTKPSALAKLYVKSAQARHQEQVESSKGPDAIALMLSKRYPVQDHGRVSINTIDMKDPDSNDMIRFVVKGRYTPFAKSESAKDFTHLVELKIHSPRAAAYGLMTDIMNYAPVPETQRSNHAASISAAVAPPAPMPSWSDDTPPLFHKQANPATISPLQQPMTASAIPPAELDAGLDDEEVAETALPPVAKSPSPAAEAITPPKQEQPVAQKASPAKTSDKHVDPAPAAPPADNGKQAEKKSEASKPDRELTFAERLRLKQNIPLKEKPAEEQPKPEPKKAAPADAETEKKPAPAAATATKKKDGEEPKKTAAAVAAGAAKAEDKKKGEVKPATAPAKDGKKAPAKDGEKTDAKASPAAGGEGKKRQLSANVIYYDLILKGLPLGTSVEELTALLEPHIAIAKPIKLESRPDKIDPATIRTFAFIRLEGENNNVDALIPKLKAKKLSLKGTNIIVDRVREKYQDVKK